ncbi:MAG: PEP-CTERM sorting domain-containing protein [Armatimonadetes bacterium]|nr:PEP-CTERM sorting domain-containing protein [Armatimonadota bacterium]
MISRLTVILVVCASLMACVVPALAAWDLAADWNETNPNGVWEYGYLDNGAWSVMTKHVDSFWGMDQPAFMLPETFEHPNLFKSVGLAGTNIPEGKVGGHSAPPVVQSGAYGVKWTAPYATEINIAGGTWIAMPWTERPHAVSLYINGVSVISMVDIPYSYDAANQFTLAAAAGDPSILQNIAIGAGESVMLTVKSTHPQDGVWVGMDLTISEVPEPGALGVLSTGVIGLLGFAARRRR